MAENMMDPHLTSPDRYYRSDDHFNAVYPPAMRMLASQHWTPLRIAREAMDFIGNDNSSVLDIGSGVGKFCLSAARYAPNVSFTGVEQRQYLIHHAQKAQKVLQIENVKFINANFTQIDLLEYDHFYFFNSFFENLNEEGRIDHHIDYSEALYEYYVRYMYNELAKTPSGTKIVTYHSLLGEIPRGFELIRTTEQGDLKCWKKI